MFRFKFHRRIFFALAPALFACAHADDVVFEKDIRPVLEARCFKCHSAEKQKAGVNLAQFKDVAALHREPKTWERVLAQLRDETMPPDDKPQPSDTERAQIVAWIDRTLDDPIAVPRDPGRAPLHRLSRAEYNNTIRDLLGVDTRPADKFPPDGGGGAGFDNNSATLFIPPILMEQYLATAADVLEKAKPERIFIAPPDDKTTKEDAARKILDAFARRAFRRPVESGEIDALMSLFARADKRGEPFEQAVKLALSAALASPNFLFRVERDSGSAGASPVSDYELASRLSYFLWSSMPDDELFRAAEEKKLHDPKVLATQVRRMLHDPKARDFAESFAGQWLRVRELTTSAQPDAGRFPNFTPALRDAMIAEPIEFFQSLLCDNGSLLDLLDSDYTFVNETLAKHYGIDGVKGDAMQRVKLSSHDRGGVLCMGAVLTLSSYPQRTSPVLRGKWVLEEILGSPPPPPPPTVKTLPSSDKPADGLTFRQRFEKHRADATCAACHKRMDPLGFGLENFDAIGAWRTEIGGQPVDASGEMVTGEKFAGPAELKKLLLARKDEFARNVAEKMFAYALNRGLEFYDAPLIRQTVKSLARDNYRVESLILAIVNSFPFQNRRGTDSIASQP